MGGLSSKSEAVPGGQTATACGRSGERCSRDSSLRDCGESGFAKKKLHQGPIVSLCALQHDCILSGGADKVHHFLMIAT